MKRIKYKILMEANIGTEENPKIVQSFGDVDFPCLDENLSAEIEKIKARAYNGEYTIEDDGEPEPPPTEQEQLRADVDFLLAMGGVL